MESMSRRAIRSRRRQHRRFMVATDFSEISLRALRFAAGLVPPRGSLALVNVQNPRAISATEFENNTWNNESVAARAAFIADCERRLKRHLPRFAPNHEVTATAMVVIGWKVPATLARVAKEWRADALCIATHGCTGLRAGILGSVTRSLLDQAAVPVIVIHVTD
jgi:nucleotide-binding universal stress UspA family protein